MAFLIHTSSLEIANSEVKVQKEMPTPPAAKAKSIAQVQAVSSSEAASNTARVPGDLVGLLSIHRNVCFAVG